MPHGVLVEGEDRCGLGEPRFELFAQHPLLVALEIEVGRRSLELSPTQLAACSLRAPLALLGLGANEQHCIATTRCDLARGVTQHALHHVAAHRRTGGLSARCTQPLPKHVGRILVGPQALRHAHGVEALEQSGTLGIFGGQASRPLHQLERLEQLEGRGVGKAARLRVDLRAGAGGAALQNLTGPHQHRRTRIDFHGSAKLAGAARLACLAAI